MALVLYIEYWHWWGLAALLIIGEILAPCYYFMALGCAAAVTGIVDRLVPDISGYRQLGLFAILSVIGLALAYWRRHRLAHKPVDK